MWTLNNIRIFVQSDTGENKNVIARLQPVSGKTILQKFGYETDTKKLQAVVVGDTDLAALQALARSNTKYTLSLDSVSQGSFYVSRVGYSRRMSISQTMRPDLDCESPVYDVEIELMEE